MGSARNLRITTASVIALLLMASSAAAGPGGNQVLTAPYADSYEDGGCQHWGTTGTDEVCRPFPYGLTDGTIGGYIQIQSADFGRYPLLQPNAGYTRGYIRGHGVLRKAAAVLPINIRIQVDGAYAYYEGTRVSDREMRAYAYFGASFRSTACCAWASSSQMLVDIDPVSATPDSFSGELVLTLQAYNVPKGEFDVEVTAHQFAEMWRGDSGEVVVQTPARLTSVTIG